MGCLQIKYDDRIPAPKNWKVFVGGVEKKNRSQKKGLDYYPFGMEMPGRKYASESYRYGYQGQYAEKEGETSLHHFELRQWDARIARWNSTDPAGQYFSPYMGMGNNPISLVDPDGAYSKFGAWWRNGFSSKGMDRVNGEWGFYEVSMSGSSSFNSNGNFTTMDMNIQFNSSDGLSQAFNNSINWDKVASGAYTTIGGTLSTVGGVVGIATGVAAPAGVGGVCLGVPAMGLGVARMIDGFQGGNRIIPGGLAEGVDIGVGGDGSVGQVVDVFSGGLPKNVISGTLMGYGIYNSNIGQIIFRSPSYNSQNMPNPLITRSDNTNVVLPTIKY
ncbi:MAG: RHS repeat-associated core domain-containing protein [Flavobacteriales bacterium]|nr:RHS repeat-associated core domain-containing protein [Flavobacteriales bacterium]